MAQPAQETENPLEAIYQLGELDWLFDIAGIQIDGVLEDGQGGTCSVHLNCSAIKPGLSPACV